MVDLVSNPRSFYHADLILHDEDLLGHAIVGRPGCEGFRRIMDSLERHSLKSPYLFAKDQHGWYATHIAAMYDNIELLKGLVEKGGADVEQKLRFKCGRMIVRHGDDLGRRRYT